MRILLGAFEAGYYPGAIFSLVLIISDTEVLRRGCIFLQLVSFNPAKKEFISIFLSYIAGIDVQNSGFEQLSSLRCPPSLEPSVVFSLRLYPKWMVSGENADG